MAPPLLHCSCIVPELRCVLNKWRGRKEKDERGMRDDYLIVVQKSFSLFSHFKINWFGKVRCQVIILRCFFFFLSGKTVHCNVFLDIHNAHKTLKLLEVLYHRNMFDLGFCGVFHGILFRSSIRSFRTIQSHPTGPVFFRGCFGKCTFNSNR